MAQPTATQLATNAQLLKRMRALGYSSRVEFDSRRNGDNFVTLDVSDLFRVIGLAEVGIRIDDLEAFLLDTGQIKSGDKVTVK